MSSVSHKAWRVRRGAYHARRQWKEAAKELGWQTTAQPNIVITPDGVLDSWWDGDSAIKDAVQRAWSRKLVNIVARCPEFGPELPS